MRSLAGTGRGPRVECDSQLADQLGSEQEAGDVASGAHGSGGPASGNISAGFDQAAQRAGCGELYLVFLQSFDLDTAPYRPGRYQR
jgi:hypothetical protein